MDVIRIKLIDLIIGLFDKNRIAFTIILFFILAAMFSALTMAAIYITKANMPWWFIVVYVLFMGYASTSNLLKRLSIAVKSKENVSYRTR